LRAKLIYYLKNAIQGDREMNDKRTLYDLIESLRQLYLNNADKEEMQEVLSALASKLGMKATAEQIYTQAGVLEVK
jgi:hypothetical protein